MVKKTAITIIGLYLFSVIGVMIGALVLNWQGDLPLQHAYLIAQVFRRPAPER